MKTEIINIVPQPNVLELTGGRSLKTNIALVENNARLAAKIARAL